MKLHTIFGLLHSQRLSTPLVSPSSSTRVSGVWKIHGRGWHSMLTPGGVDQTITMSGSLRPISLRLMLTKENMQVRYECTIVIMA